MWATGTCRNRRLRGNTGRQGSALLLRPTIALPMTIRVLSDRSSARCRTMAWQLGRGNHIRSFCADIPTESIGNSTGLVQGARPAAAAPPARVPAATAVPHLWRVLPSRPSRPHPPLPGRRPPAIAGRHQPGHHSFTRLPVHRLAPVAMRRQSPSPAEKSGCSAEAAGNRHPTTAVLSGSKLLQCGKKPRGVERWQANS